MELKEFVGLKPSEIRRDKGLMQLYVDFYEAAFFLKPNCIGCSFKSGFKKLKKYANNGEKTVNLVENTKPMETKTFILKNQYKLKILSYKEEKVKDGKKKTVIHRKYGHSITEDFARELVKAGRTEIFAKLPGGGKAKDTVKETIQKFVGEPNSDGSTEYTHTIGQVSIPYNKMDYRTELLPLYNEIKDRTGKSAVGKSKQDIIEFLEKHEG